MRFNKIVSIITKFSCLLVCLYPIFRAKLNKERREEEEESIVLYLSRRKKFFVSQFIRKTPQWKSRNLARLV